MSEKQVKKPVLFYWEDAEDCFCVATESDFPDLVSQMVKRGVKSERLDFYYMDTPDQKNKLVYDVGQTTLSMPSNDTIENYIALDYLDEGDDIELSVKIEFMTDAEYSALPEI